mgnify:CR=1 FL=1
MSPGKQGACMQHHSNLPLEGVHEREPTGRGTNAGSLRHRGPKILMLAALLYAATVPLTACTQPMNDTPGPEYRENPDPRQAYRLTMTIEDAPGPLKIMVSAAQYDVVNRECLPPPKDNPGGRSSPVPTNDIPFELTRISDNQYTGIVYLDGMIDDDYHGRGVCRWELIQAQVQLKATGAETETRFFASLSRNSGAFDSGNPTVLYYSKHSYPRHPEAMLDEPLSFGQADRSGMASWLTDEDVFSIALAAEQAAP